MICNYILLVYIPDYDSAVCLVDGGGGGREGDSIMNNKYILFLIFRLLHFGRLQTIIRHSAMNVTEVFVGFLILCSFNSVTLLRHASRWV